MLFRLTILFLGTFSLQAESLTPTPALPQSILGLIDEATTKIPQGPEIFTVSDAKGSVCTIASLDADISILAQGKQIQLQTPDAVTTDPESNCDLDNPARPLLVLSWSTFKLCFYISKAQQNWTLDKIALAFNSSELGLNFTSQDVLLATKTNASLAEAANGYSYRCFAPVTYEFELLKNLNISGNITLSNFQLEPFLQGKNTFSKEMVCANDVSGKVVRRRSDTVTIAVGSTLTVAAVVTVVAYAIYRHVKVKSFGYDTMQ